MQPLETENVWNFLFQTFAYFEVSSGFEPLYTVLQTAA